MNTSIGSHGAIPTRKCRGKLLFGTVVDPPLPIPPIDATDAEIIDALLECLLVTGGVCALSKDVECPSKDALSEEPTVVIGRVADVVPTSFPLL